MEDLDSWEVILDSYVLQQPPSSSPLQEEEDLGVFIKENFYDESAVLPQSEHEGLEVSKEESFEISPSSSSSSSSFSACSESEDGYLQQSPEPVSWVSVSVHQMSRHMKLRMNNLSRKIVSAIWPCSACRAKTWTLNSVTAFMTAVAFTLAYARMKRRHKKALEESKYALLIPLRQQEQKISQLLLQIAQMNEMISARRRVQVIYAY